MDSKRCATSCPLLCALCLWSWAGVRDVWTMTHGKKDGAKGDTRDYGDGLMVLQVMCTVESPVVCSTGWMQHLAKRASSSPVVLDFHFLIRICGFGSQAPVLRVCGVVVGASFVQNESSCASVGWTVRETDSRYISVSLLLPTPAPIICGWWSPITQRAFFGTR